MSVGEEGERGRLGELFEALAETGLRVEADESPAGKLLGCEARVRGQLVECSAGWRRRGFGRLRGKRQDAERMIVVYRGQL